MTREKLRSYWGDFLGYPMLLITFVFLNSLRYGEQPPWIFACLIVAHSIMLFIAVVRLTYFKHRQFRDWFYVPFSVSNLFASIFCLNLYLFDLNWLRIPSEINGCLVNILLTVRATIWIVRKVKEIRKRDAAENNS
jgi:hypothetical protein